MVIGVDWSLVARLQKASSGFALEVRFHSFHNEEQLDNFLNLNSSLTSLKIMSAYRF